MEKIVELPIGKQFQIPCGGSCSVLDTLELKIGYDKGGMNYFTYDVRPRAINLYFKPIHAEGGFVSSVMLGDIRESGFRITLVEVKRKNAKKEQALADAIMPHAEELLHLWEMQNYSTLDKKVHQYASEAL